jgi:hypothetical protein
LTTYTIEYAAAPAHYTIEFAKGTGPQGATGGGGGGGGSLTVREVDGSPTGTATEIVFSNGSIVSFVGTVVTVSALDGNTIHSVTDDPEPSLGRDGDYALNYESSFLWGPKTGGDWGTSVYLGGYPSNVVRNSASSVTIGTGSKTFAATSNSPNLGWVEGMRLRAAFDGFNYVEGTITAVSETSVTINADLAVGSGTRTGWNIGIAGDRGATGGDGKTVLSGSGVPSSGLGVNGDFYIDFDDTIIYGPKTAGAWGSGTELIGGPGNTGAPGIAATIAVGTVTTGAPGSSVAIVNGGSSSAAVFNFTIPRGDTGSTGPAGAAGQGVPTGGETNAILAKVSGVDYATTWTNTPILDGLTLRFRTITYAATIAVDLSLGSKKKVTLTGSPTISAPTGTPIDGAQLIFRIIQGGAGSHAITWDPVYKFRGPFAGIVWSTAVGAKDHVTFVYDADATPSPEWDCLSFAKGS